MRRRILLITFLVGVAAAAAAEITSADLVGEWFGGTSSIVTRYTFRADHSFDYTGGDAHGAGKWRLHDGKKLELIYHYDYERKLISSLSKRDWIVVESVSKGRLRFRWYHKDLSPGFQLSSPEVLTKQR
jgi:hypothetical protein